MIQQTGKRFLEGMREWPSAAGEAQRRIRLWGEAASRLPRRMGERPAMGRPSLWLKATGAARFRPAWAALAAAGALLAVAAIILYLRKRRQVADHFTMGEGEAEAAKAGGTSGAVRDAEMART